MTWRNIIKIIKTGQGEYDIHLICTDSLVGNLLMKEDGYYDFWFPLDYKPTGFFDSNLLRAIADCLDEVNKEWDEQVKQELK